MSCRSQRTELDQINVASPCSARWEEMAGDEKVRFCGECRLNVYNLSAMDVEEAGAVIARDEERTCVRFYRRADGTILTRDCPVGQEERRRKSRRNTVEKAVWSAIGASFAGLTLMPTQGAVARPASRAAALILAARQQDPAELRRLLDAGLDPNCAMMSGSTPLMAAAVCGRVEATRLLIANGADVHARDKSGDTALALAIANGHDEVVKLLRQARARH